MAYLYVMFANWLGTTCGFYYSHLIELFGRKTPPAGQTQLSRVNCDCRGQEAKPVNEGHPTHLLLLVLQA